MRRRRHHALIILSAALATGGAIANGCSATGGMTPFTGAGGAGAMGGSGASVSGAGGAGGSMSVSAGSPGAGGGDIVLPDGGPDAEDDVTVNPCGSKCGPKELCDPDHLGLDDNCDGQVDEGCGCSSGQVHFCFKGDPSYHNVPGCFDGSEKCGESGIWGPCTGGLHATAPDLCFNNDTSNCHAISAAPFADINLKTGTGAFSANAVPGSELWTVTCPMGVNPCPAVSGTNPADDFKPLQSGEYSVTYSKVVPGGGAPQSCTYPLFVGAPGLRVELTWEHNAMDTGVDLDLHVHQPNDTKPWGVNYNVPQDCNYKNCVYKNFSTSPQPIDSPSWFADPPAMPPTPMNWWRDTMVESNNTCYSAPRGVGAEWEKLGLGCHNPRLDLDNTHCNVNITDPNDIFFCAPENINIDFPPNDQWIRIGVYYYTSNALTYDVHPDIKIFCSGALAGQLGSAGYYAPKEAPITFSPIDGQETPVGHRFWIVADVAFKHDQCTNTCIVKPIYSNKTAKTPFFTNAEAASNIFAPGYPPAP